MNLSKKIITISLIANDSVSSGNFILQNIGGSVTLILFKKKKKLHCHTKTNQNVSLKTIDCGPLKCHGSLLDKCHTSNKKMIRNV